MKRILVFLLASIAGYAPAMLAVPQLINYQGSLTRPDGAPLDTSVTMTFKLWSASSAGVQYWTETDAPVAVARGLFNVSLGQVTALPDSILNHTQVWLGITVGGDAEMTPRVRMKSVAYSYRVGTVDGATGGTITGDVNVIGKGNIGTGNSNSGTGAFVTGTIDTASGANSTVGGYSNIASGDEATVGGGSYSMALADFCTVSGGYNNNASGTFATIGGGYVNVASGLDATVGGGGSNIASGSGASVDGGIINTAGGAYSTIPGGYNCVANGDFSFVAGRNVKTNSNASGAFAWGDNYGLDTMVVGTANRVVFRAANGYRLYTADNLTSGVLMNAGDGAWSSVSDSTKKQNRRNVDTKAILEKVMNTPIQQWSYKSQDPSIEHIGPMAQDFYAQFHLGDSDTTVSTIDPSGVALAAIQELAKENSKLKIQNSELEERIARLETRMQSLMADKKQSAYIKTQGK